ncbi:hypothetical protein OROMI_027913 [Orobanche minor]
MASSQTSQSQMKRAQIIDGRLFSRSTVLNRLQSEVEDTDNMEVIIDKIRDQGLHRIGNSRSSFYDEEIVEEFYQDAIVKLYCRKHGGGVRDIRATVQGIRIRIDSSFLESSYALPTEGMSPEELESFGSEKLLTAYWGLFTGDKSRKDIHMSCPKKNVCLPFIYIHDFCCRIVENRTVAFNSCTNLRYRMMVAILYGEKIDWCQFVLNRLGEEVFKPQPQKKSFGLFLNNLLVNCGVTRSPDAKKIGPDKFLGGSKPTAYHHAGPLANRLFIRTMPNIQHPRRSFEKSSAAEDLSKKRTRSVSDNMSPLIEKKKLKKDSRSKSEGTVANHVTIDDQPLADTADPNSQEAARAEASPSPVPIETLSDQQIFANLENLDSSVQIDSMINSPVRASIPEQDPTHNRVPSPVCGPHLNRNPSPVRDSSPHRVPTPVRDPSPIQASIPVEDPNPTENPIPLRSPSPSRAIFNPQVEQAFQRFKQWKSYKIEMFNNGMTSTCHMLIVSHFMSQDAARLEEKGKSAVPDQTARKLIIEKPLPSKPATGHPGASSSQAPTHVIHPDSQATARTEHLENLSRQTVFLSEAVDALYQVGKEMDWLNLSAIEESASIRDELSKIKKAFGEFLKI